MLIDNYTYSIKEDEQGNQSAILHKKVEKADHRSGYYLLLIPGNTPIQTTY